MQGRPSELSHVSHVSHKTMRNVLKIARSPTIFSHSSCNAMAKNYRNVPDDVLVSSERKVAVLSWSCSSSDSSMLRAQIWRQRWNLVYHVAETAGRENVGIGKSVLC
jgi:membrane dipeptidase